MKNLIKTAAFCAALVFTMSFSVMANENTQHRTTETDVSYVKLTNSSFANCSIMVGVICDTATATAVTVSKAAGKLCGDKPDSDKCSAALINANTAAAAAFAACLGDLLLEDTQQSSNQNTNEIYREHEIFNKTGLAKI